MENQAHPKVQGPLHVLPEVWVLSVSQVQPTEGWSSNRGSIEGRFRTFGHECGVLHR